MTIFQNNVNSKDKMVQIKQFTRAFWKLIKDDASFHNVGSSLGKQYLTTTAVISKSNSQVNPGAPITSNSNRTIDASFNTINCSKIEQLFDYYGEPIN